MLQVWSNTNFDNEEVRNVGVTGVAGTGETGTESIISIHTQRLVLQEQEQ